MTQYLKVTNKADRIPPFEFQVETVIQQIHYTRTEKKRNVQGYNLKLAAIWCDEQFKINNMISRPSNRQKGRQLYLLFKFIYVYIYNQTKC